MVRALFRVCFGSHKRTGNNAQVGFDREKYLTLQGERIEARRRQFGGKLYLEFGGKLVDDMHASRVLPGFTPDNKIVMLAGLADEV